MASGDICVSAQGVSKKFSRSLKRSFVYGARDIGQLLLGRKESDVLRPSEFWALRDVSFQLPRGKSIGVVGLNGSGKTTLMRLVSGIMKPTLGKVDVHGRIAPMLALGAGFKPVLSGRENIFLNLALLGVSEKDVRARYESIVDFAELSESIEAPIGTYSSGMRARLGFACAIHTDPQILVVDEVLSVGDARFRMKCRNRINEMRRNGTSMLLVSHSAILIETLSDECLFLQKGRVAAKGNPATVLRAYEEAGVETAAQLNEKMSKARAENVGLRRDAPVQLSSVTLSCGDQQQSGHWVCGVPGALTIKLKSNQARSDLSVNLMVIDLTHQQGETVLFLMSSRDLGRLELSEGSSELRLHLPHVGLRPGSYRLKISVSSGTQHDILDVVDDVRLVVRDAGKASNNLYYQPRDWVAVGGQFDGAVERLPVDEIFDAEEA